MKLRSKRITLTIHKTIYSKDHIFLLMISLVQSFVLAMILVSSSCSSDLVRSASNEQLNTVVIKPGETLRGLEDFHWGFNAQMMRGPSWKASGFVEQVSKLNPQVIRYPGGTVASYWDWEAGWLQDGIELQNAWKNIPRSPITLEDLKWACDHTGAKPVFVLNMIHSNIKEQLRMLRHADSIGLQIEMVEFDNEVYLGREVYAKRFADADAYVKECAVWQTMIQKEFPGIKFGFAAHASRGQGGNSSKKYVVRTTNWNRALNLSGHEGNAIILHNYSGSGLRYLSGNKDRSDLELWNKTFNDSATPEVILGIPFSTWSDLQNSDIKYFGPDRKIWITEYNMFEREGIVAGTWTHGLYALLQTLLMTADPQVELLCYHNLVTSAQFGAIYYSNDAFHKALHPVPTQLYGLSAAGMTLAIYGEALNKSDKIQQLSIENNEMNSTFRGRKYPDVIGFSFNKPSSSDLLLLNLSDQKKAIKLEGIRGSNFQYQHASCSPTEKVAFEKDVIIKKGQGVPETLPAYSVTLISAF